MKRRGY